MVRSAQPNPILEPKPVTEQDRQNEDTSALVTQIMASLHFSLLLNAKQSDEGKCLGYMKPVARAP